MGLLDSVKGVMTNAVVDKVSDVIGIENGMAKSAIKLILPAIIGGVINKGSSASGAGGLLDLFKNGGFGDDNLGDLAGVLGDPAKKDGWLSTGSDLLGNIFGNNQSGVLDMILKATGISKGAGGSLLSFLAPIVINKLAGIVMGRNMNASQLTSYLGEQKSEVMGLVPGLGGLLGGDIKEDVAAAVGASKAASTSEQKSGGGGFLKYLLPLALLALGIWYFTKGKTAPADTTTTEVTTEAAPATTTTAVATEPTTATEKSATTTATTEEYSTLSMEDLKSYTFAANGDLMTGSGSVAYAGGTYDLDANGNLVSTDGKIIAPAAALGGDFMAKLKSALGTFKLEKMKLMFADMIVKKEGAVSSYGLSDIVFNKEDHKITNFTKSEVVGLAEALKANAEGKIEVHVYTANAGDDGKANKKLSETRAKVIRDMLVTLGVDGKQIKAVGKGTEDAAKASAEKVDIVVN